MPITNTDMVSIRKYLDLRDAHRPTSIESSDSESSDSPVLAGLCSSILDHVGTYVLAGGTDSDLRIRLEQARGALVPGATELGEEPAQRIGDMVRGALASHAAREREAAQRVAVETQHVVGVLNQALMVIGGGSDRSVSRLRRIQEALHRTSLIRDADGLRASLADATKLIREEAAREQEQAARDLAGFESEVNKVREHIAANPIRRLPGRAEAVQALADRARTLAPSSFLYVAAFSFDNMRAIIQRYGIEPVDELFFQVIRERIQPIAPVNTAWRWSAGGIVSAFERSRELAHPQTELACLCRSPLVYHMRLGGRTAVLKVSVSHLLLMATPETLETLVEQLDRFGGAGN